MERHVAAGRPISTHRRLEARQDKVPRQDKGVEIVFGTWTWRIIVPVLLGVSLDPTPSMGAQPPFSHALLNQILQERVDAEGRVDYAGLASHRGALDAYMDSLRLVSPAAAPQRFGRPQDALAYWINAYNAIVLHSVLKSYPMTSVADAGGLDAFFRQQRHLVGGDWLSLDEIENSIIRPQYSDARIHFAVNCGARSCPALDQQAYSGDSLDTHLERQTRRFATDPQHVQWRDGELWISKLLEWYRLDFNGEGGGDTELLDFLRPYAPPSVTDQLHSQPVIRYFDYDWALNDQRGREDRRPGDQDRP